jgi:hypothetical protein
MHITNWAEHAEQEGALLRRSQLEVPVQSWYELPSFMWIDLIDATGTDCAN